MKLKVILPPVTYPTLAVPPIGLGTLMASLDADDEVIVTAEQAQQDAMWEDADVVAITIGPLPSHAFNLAELYSSANIHVVLIGADVEFLAEPDKPKQTIFAGPADDLWPAFLNDYRRGEPGYRYADESTLRDAGLFIGSEHIA